LEKENTVLINERLGVKLEYGDFKNNIKRKLMRTGLIYK